MITLLSRYLTVMPVVYWQWIFICSIWLFATTYFFVRRNKMLFLIISVVIMLIAGVALTWYYHIHSQGLISLTQPITLHAGPSKKYHALCPVNGPCLCCVKKEGDEWMCVEHDGGKGWLSLKQQT